MIVICEYCGKEFERGSSPKIYCSAECKKKKYSENQKKVNLEKKAKKKAKNEHIFSFLEEVEEYNKKHNTYLSYGQYESMKHQLLMQKQAKKMKRRSRSEESHPKSLPCIEMEVANSQTRRRIKVNDGESIRVFYRMQSVNEYFGKSDTWLYDLKKNRGNDFIYRNLHITIEKFPPERN